LIGGLRDDVPGVVCDVLARALSRDASARPASVAELRASLHDRWRRAGLWEKAPPAPEDDAGAAPEVAASVGLLRTCYAATVTAPGVSPSAFNEVTPPAAMTLPVVSVDDAAPTWVAHESNPVLSPVDAIHEHTSVDLVLPEHDLERAPSVDALPQAIFAPTEVATKVPSDLAAMARESVRARTRTLGFEEVSANEHPPLTAVQESTRMLEVNDWWAQPHAPRASDWSNTPGDPFAHAVSEPTQAIDLSSSGAFVTPQRPTFHAQPRAPVERHAPSGLPPDPRSPPQAPAWRRPVWIIAVLVVVLVLFVVVAIAALS
jgi:hypothetical protein